MLDSGRRSRIVEYVEKSDGARVDDLADRFGVSRATIRRDLTRLHEEGLIERAHGGATPKRHGRIGGMMEPPILSRSSIQPEEKRAIGELAAKFVEDGDVIYVSGGSTTAEMIPYLSSHRNLTVITNALNIATLLAPLANINAIIVGGTLRHSEMSMLGALTEDALRNLRVDRLFTGTPAIHPEHGLSADDLTEVQSDKNIMSIAREITVLADHTKFGCIATMIQARLEEIDRVVTDSGTGVSDVERIRERGIEVHVADMD